LHIIDMLIACCAASWANHHGTKLIEFLICFITHVI